MTIERGIAEVNGTRLAYEVTGDGPPVVFLHGFTLDMRMWDDQVPAFAARHRVVRYDLRGFGASAPPVVDEPYTHADDLRALMTHLGIERAAIVGLSMGGWAAQEFALTYPESVDALILVGSVLDGHPWSPAAADVLEAISRLGAEGRLAEAKAGWLAAPIFAYSRGFPAVVARLEQMVAEYGCWELLNEDPHRPLDPLAIERLPEISAPTLAIVGEHDIPDFHTIADLLAARIAGAQTVVIPEAGHMANMDAPDAFNRVVLDFLASDGATALLLGQPQVEQRHSQAHHASVPGDLSAEM
jgi:pimeloyl-ACP methyl ester carboxylesterase